MQRQTISIGAHRVILTAIRSYLRHVVGLAILVISTVSAAQAQAQSATFGLAIHGGAGTISRDKITPELEAEYRSKLAEALTAGFDILQNGGSSFDAVETAIIIMEDSPLFNAGKGAVFSNDGTNELDAMIMDGATLQAGAVASVKHIKNPISLARLVLEKSPHVLMVGAGAEDFGAEHGMKKVPNSYFYTEKRWKSLEDALEKQSSSGTDEDKASDNLEFRNREKGTVGCVALDKNGHLAAGTSTGGLTNKMWGRVGDSPIIGAGTYANDATCAVSGTGQGEYFMRLLVAYDIHALMAYQGLALDKAANEVVMEKLTGLGGKGGVIAIDRQGNVAMPFNTTGMYRGHKFHGQEMAIRIYANEEP